MKKTKVSLDSLLQKDTCVTLGHMFRKNEIKFKERFGFDLDLDVKVTLEFDSYEDARIFYSEVKYSQKYYEQYNVQTHPYDTTKVIISGAETLFDYFGTREPNLLTLSREQGINFKIDYLQEFSNIIFTGEVIQGELLGRHCLVEVSDLLPEIAIAGMHYIARTHSEFEALLTRIFKVESVMLIWVN